MTVTLIGKVALVAGAASTLGATVAHLLADAGATIAVADQCLGQAPQHNASTHRVDMADPDAVSRCVREVLREHDRIDVLVNCAATDGSASSSDPGAHRSSTRGDTAIAGIVLMSQEVGRHMIDSGGGRIINLIAPSPDGHREDDDLAQRTARTVVTVVSRGFALEWGTRGITVNVVDAMDGLADANSTNGHGHDEAIAPSLTAPFTAHSELAAIMRYLASDESAMVNGAVLRLERPITC